MTTHTPAIGENITTVRKAAGLTQRQLATRANISLSMLSKVEIGDRAASHALIAAVSRALGTSIERLQGQPHPGSSLTLGRSICLDGLRSALRSLSLTHSAALVTADRLRARPLIEIRANLEQLIAHRRAGRYTKLAIGLPSVIEDLAIAVVALQEQQTRAQACLVDALYLAHSLAFRLGHNDFAELIGHRLSVAAEASHDPLALGLARWTHISAFQANGDYDRGLELVNAALRELPPPDGPGGLALRGSLHLRAVTLAARKGDHPHSVEHLQQARSLATKITRDVHRYHLTFGPTNTGIHEVAAAVELGHPERAITVGQQLELPTGLPATRAGHFYLDLARAHVALADRPATLAALERARKVAPEHTKFHPMAAETTRVLISLHRRANPDLTRFTSWLGLATP